MATPAHSNILKLSITIAWIFVCSLATAADTLITRLSVPHLYFTTDVYNNVYCINADNEVIRWNVSGTQKVTFSNQRFGKPTLVDAGNPLKTIVYYADLQTLVILDKMLADIAVLRFSNLNGTAYRPLMVCRASGGDHIWMFDDLTQRLMRLDESGNRIAQSEPWYQLFDTGEVPVWMKSLQDQVYIYTTSGQLHQFDAFGTPGKSYTLPSVPEDILNDQVLLNDAQGARLFDLQTAQETILPGNYTGKMIRLQPQHLFIGDKQVVEIFRSH